MIYPDNFERKIGFDSVRKHLESLCHTTKGRELCAEMHFLTDFKHITRLIEETAEMVTIKQSDNEGLPIGKVRDISESISSLRVPGSFASATVLNDIAVTIEAFGEITSFFTRNVNDEDSTIYPRLSRLALNLTPLPSCHSAITRVIDRYGNIKDNASPELAEIRSSISRLQNSLSSRTRRIMQQAIADGYLSADATPSMRDGRLVIPVAPMYKRKIGGIVHDESASGKTVFIEPAEIVESNNRIRELQIEEKREITRILLTVSDILREHLDDIVASIEVAAAFDFIDAKARYGIDTEATVPTISPKLELEWYHACHPVLRAALKRQGREIVPLDITLDKRDRILIISGPNAGGKSVTLKTVAIVQYMLQCGILPPVYENSHMGIFHDIMVDIGDDQSLEDDLSTYSSHLKNMKLMLQRGHHTSLVLIDEMGSGTEPQIGGALAQSLLKAFNEKRMWGIITTHYQNIKTFAEDTPGLINGSMLYDRQMMKPLFKLSIGNAGSSFAVEIARKIGLPADIIAGAEEIVGSDYINLDKYLLDIARDKRYWENKRNSIKAKEKKIESVLEDYENRATELREKRREIIDDARRQAERILEGSNASIERTIHDIKKANAEKEATIQARERLRQERKALTESPDNDHPLLKKAPKAPKKAKAKTEAAAVRALTPGDTVKLEGQSTPGKIIEINGKQATVVFGMLKTTVALNRLKPSTATIKTGAEKPATISGETSSSSRSRQLNFKQEIDVRGMRVDEGVQAVTYFIDDAIQFNAGRVRILHGTGTGALRQYIRDYLSTVPGVRNYHDEDVRFGGAGITVVELD